MTNKSRRSWTPHAIILASLALGIELVDYQLSFAKVCGEYCEAKQVWEKCKDVVKKSNLKGQHRVAEFEKCKAHLLNSENPKEKGQDVRSSSGF
jgi:hypothetical protein